MTALVTPYPAGRALKGVLLVVAATFCFALSDTLAKHLTALYAVALIMTARNVVNLGLLGAVLGPGHGAALWRTHRTGLVVLRGLSLATGSLTMGLALRVMPVGETVAILYLSPFLVMLLAGPLLGEKTPPAAWLGAAVGFAGILLIVRPGGGLDPWGVTLAMINGLCATAYHLLSRVLTRTETTPALLFHAALVGIVVFAALLVYDPPTVYPTLRDSLLIILFGALATLGHFAFTAAYREAPAALLAPVNYLHLVWAALLGWIVFAHVPDRISLLGMAMVAGSGVMVAIRAKRT
jgi:drug/metabolite transporter (DMT)-like permease